MLKLIEEMLNARFAFEDDVYYPYDDDGFSIYNAVIQMFMAEEFPLEDYSVKYETVFESTGMDVAVLSVAFIDWGKLNHKTFTVISC